MPYRFRDESIFSDEALQEGCDYAEEKGHSHARTAEGIRMMRELGQITSLIPLALSECDSIDTSIDLDEDLKKPDISDLKQPLMTRHCSPANACKIPLRNLPSLRPRHSFPANVTSVRTTQYETHNPVSRFTLPITYASSVPPSLPEINPSRRASFCGCAPLSIIPKAIVVHGKAFSTGVSHSRPGSIDMLPPVSRSIVFKK